MPIVVTIIFLLVLPVLLPTVALHRRVGRIVVARRGSIPVVPRFALIAMSTLASRMDFVV